jgi:iron-sulfur cluster assembly accessory protein
MELCPISLTESAISHVSSILAENSDVNLRLRIYVSGGGCSGLQYGMALDTEVDPDDTIFDHEGVAIILSAYDQKYLLGSIVDFIEDMNQVYDMPVMLNSVSPEIDYEGDFMSTRLIIWNLNFTAKAYIWPPVNYPTSNKGLITRANVNIYADSTNLNAQKVFVDYANGKSGYFTTGEDIGVINKDTTGKVLYFSNTAAGQLVVTDLTQRLDVGDKLVGLYSNSRYTIKTVDSSPTKAVAIVIIPKPAGANVDTAYGFEEIFTEWPNTL